MDGWKMHLQQQQAGTQLPEEDADWGAPNGTGGRHKDGSGERGSRAAPGQLKKDRE
jgi:hypothetical protein